MSITIWIVIALAIIAACAGSRWKSGKNAGAQDQPTRIGHPHYVDLDDFECSVCGARFRQKSMVCPNCGARFAGTRDDDQEFIEEMVIWDDDDDD